MLRENPGKGPLAVRVSDQLENEVIGSRLHFDCTGRIARSPTEGDVWLTTLHKMGYS